MNPKNALEDPRLGKTEYVVEATSAEAHFLWREYSKEAHVLYMGSPFRKGRTPPRVDWQQDRGGWLTTVGELLSHPIAMNLGWVRLNGHLVLFWEATSRVVDYDMCRDWLTKHVPAYAAGHHTDATNFAHCLAFVEDATSQRSSR